MEEARFKAEGWFRLPTVRYSAALGAVWARLREGGESVEVAMVAGEHLGNDNFGIVHGGALMTYADMALGCAVGHSVGQGYIVGKGSSARFVTAQMQVQFTAAAKVGDLLIARPDLVRKTSQLVFVRTLIQAGDKTVASADGIFKLLDDAKVAGMKAG